MERTAVTDSQDEVKCALRAVRARLTGVALDESTRWQLDLACGARSTATARDCARGLMAAGLLAEAEMIFQALQRCGHGSPAGLAGLAQVASRSHRWEYALDCWDALLGQFPAHPAAPTWLVARAHVLVRLGCVDHAEHLFRRLLAQRLQPRKALLGLLRVLTVTGRPEQALLELDSSEFRSLEAPEPVMVKNRLDILVQLKRLDDARTQLERLLEQSEEPAMLETLFNFTPLLYDRPERTRIWKVLLGRVHTLERQHRWSDAGAPAALKVRLLLALRDYAGFLQAMDTIAEPCSLGSYGPRLRALATTLRERSVLEQHEPKIFGIGLSKTGTTTLGVALFRLGYQVLDWHNPLTRELIGEDDYPLFDAFTDTPVTASFEKLYFLFDESRFIYTARPLESWRRSMTQHWLRNYGVLDFDAIRALLATGNAFPFGRQFREIHASLYFDYPNLDAAYHAHDQRVRSFFHDKPRHRFLEFNVFEGHGWPQLCQFLNRAAPLDAFPWENRSPARSGRLEPRSCVMSACGELAGIPTDSLENRNARR
jgi:tetratricopeptide (TPR) repeat protein